MPRESPQNNNIDNEEVSLKLLILKIQEWCRYLLSKWIIIIVFGLLGASSGFLYAYFKKPVYTATTTFVLEDEKGGGSLGNLAGLASIAGVDISGSGGGIFQGDNILGLYKSRAMLEKTLLTPIEEGGRKHLLVDKYIEFNKLKEKWDGKPELLVLNFKDSIAVNNNIRSKRLRDSILGEIIIELNKDYLEIAKPDKKLSIIQVGVKARDESFAKTFNDELVKNVNDFYIETKTKKTLQNVQILQHKTDSVRAVMNGAIYNAVAVADATPNLNPTRQIQRLAPAQRSQFSAETNKSILAEMVKNLEMTKMSLLKETPLIQVIDQPVYPLPKAKFGKVKGVILGGLSFGILTVLFLVLRKIYQNILI